MIDWGYIESNGDLIQEKFIEHVELTFIAVAIGLAISLPLGIYAARHKRAYGVITAVTGIMYTIPSLALFAFLVPITGLSTVTVEVGLVSYTLLILIRNIVSGLHGVSPEAVEAATGMGYSRRQLLWKVEIPLALPVIIAGIRLATVTTIGLVTVTALIGKGGLGYFILLGLRSFGLNQTASILGAVLSIALAIAVDALLLLSERFLTPWARTRRVKVFA